jgi:hypothetical protein
MPSLPPVMAMTFPSIQAPLGISFDIENGVIVAQMNSGDREIGKSGDRKT